MERICRIAYAVICHQGPIRGRNQDNFWRDGVFLPYENNGLVKALDEKGKALLRRYLRMRAYIMAAEHVTLAR